MRREFFASFGWNLATGEVDPQRLSKLGLDYISETKNGAA